jgi:hypothetical protein
MLFKVENSATGRFTHCGVLEFVADEGMVYLPHWVSTRCRPYVDVVSSCSSPDTCRFSMLTGTSLPADDAEPAATSG